MIYTEEKQKQRTSAPQTEKHRQVIERARKRWAAHEAAESEIRAEALLDIRYVLGEQWDEKAKIDRNRRDRPMLVFNKLHTQVQQLSNQARQNKPAITVNPVGGGADKADAEINQGIIRHVEYESNADLAYDTALECAASCSLGYYKIGCDWAGDDTFDQDLSIDPVYDPFSIRMDHTAKRFDKKDALWAFEEERFSKGGFKEEFGFESRAFSDDMMLDLIENEWIDDESVRVARYWEVELTEYTLREYIGADGIAHGIHVEDIDPKDVSNYDWTVDQKGKIRERQGYSREVIQYVIDGADVIDEIPWDGDHIPIIPVFGKRIVVKGKTHLISLIRFCRDPQKLHNYYKTMEAEVISLAPKPKWIGYVGQFKTKLKDWQRANIDTAAFLEADVVMAGDKPAPLPEWQAFDPPVQALNVGALSTADDIKAGSGYFDPSLGQQQIDQSGVALRQLQSRGDISNFHFIDNLGRSLKTGGEYLLQLIPIKYSTAREMEIVREDEKREVVMLNAPYKNARGVEMHHKIAKSEHNQRRFGIVVRMGTSYQTQREEIRTMLTELSNSNQMVAQVAMPVIFDNYDFKGADKIAIGLRAIADPRIQKALAASEQGISPEVAQMQATVDGLQQQVQQLTQVLQTKLLKIESDERQTTQTNMVKLQAAELASKQAAGAQAFQATHEAVQGDLERKAALYDHLLDIMTQGQLQQGQQAHEAAQGQADRDHQMAMAQAQPPASPSA